MKTLGLVLIAGGFLGGALVAVQTAENEVAWAWYAPALGVGVLGVALARLATRAEARHEGKLSAGIRAVRESLDRIVANVRTLDGEKADLDVYDAHGRIDALFRGDLTTFVDAREAIGHVFGLSAYADVMNDFAAGERYLNRVWSSSIDGWVDEMKEYLGHARLQFEEAQRKLHALGPGPA